MKTTNSDGCLEERLIQCVTSYVDKKLKRYARKASNTIFSSILGQKLRSELPSQLRTTNSEGSIEERLIHFVSVFLGNKPKS